MSFYREPQYDRILELDDSVGRFTLGSMSNQVWHDDSKRLGFVLARYKFVSKMLASFSDVLEVGCADAFGSHIVAKEVTNLTVSDFDESFVGEVSSRETRCPFKVVQWNVLDGEFPSKSFDAIYALDVIEHIDPEDEHAFLSNLAASLRCHGVLILGSPSIESQPYASEASKLGHVNCKSEGTLRQLCSEYFHNVFLFGMNDESLTTGFGPMCHYRLAVCVGPKMC